MRDAQSTVRDGPRRENADHADPRDILTNSQVLNRTDVLSLWSRVATFLQSPYGSRERIGAHPLKSEKTVPQLQEVRLLRAW